MAGAVTTGYRNPRLCPWSCGSGHSSETNRVSRSDHRTGHGNAELASRLFLSPTAVKSHVGRILSKLDLRDRVQAVDFAYETGLIAPGEAPR